MEQADEANHPYHVKEIINFMQWLLLFAVKHRSGLDGGDFLSLAGEVDDTNYIQLDKVINSLGGIKELFHMFSSIFKSIGKQSPAARKEKHIEHFLTLCMENLLLDEA